MTSVPECPVAPGAPLDAVVEPLRVMYDQHATALLAFAEQFTSRASAEDAVQETFLRAWRNLERLRADPRPLRPWLTLVLRRVLIDANRAERARPVSLLDDALFDRAVDGGYDRLLQRWRLDQALGALSPSHRHVLVEIYYRDSSTDRVAVSLGIPPGTVRSRLHYALRALRRHLIDAPSRHPPSSIDRYDPEPVTGAGGSTGCVRPLIARDR